MGEAAIKITPIESVVDQARRLRRAAHAGPIGKRQSSFTLYAMLADCMALAQRASVGSAGYDELVALVREQPHEGKGRWTLKGSDEYIVVCRYVFPTGSRSAERANASRYAHALREAAKRRIYPHELAGWLSEHGGINALFLARPGARRTVTTKTLYLSRQIEARDGEAFSIVLRRRTDNLYDVLSGPSAAPVEDTAHE